MSDFMSHYVCYELGILGIHNHGDFYVFNSEANIIYYVCLFVSQYVHKAMLWGRVEILFTNEHLLYNLLCLTVFSSGLKIIKLLQENVFS